MSADNTASRNPADKLVGATFSQRARAWIGPLAVVMLAAAPCAHADVVTDANAKAAEIASRIPGTPPAVRAMAIVQVSVFEAANAITGRYPTYRVKLTAAPGASVDAAVAAATRTALLKLIPAQQAAIDADYQAALRSLPDGRAKSDGIAVGDQAASAIVAACADDGAVAPNTYRPYTTPGVYVPTTSPAVPHRGKRRPWVMTSGDQFRPGPPPALTSDVWKRDFDEIKALGGMNSSKRTPDQTAIARFWEATAPNVYWPVARSVATAPGRDVTDNARLLAMAAMAMDDALIAVFDAKYTYNLWRPVTAIRNGDLDGNNATDPDPGWTPFVATPNHPEYPAAHGCVTGSVMHVVRRFYATDNVAFDFSSTVTGTTRRFARTTDLVAEMQDGRVWGGMHYRTSTVVGTALGRDVVNWMLEKQFRPAD